MKRGEQDNTESTKEEAKTKKETKSPKKRRTADDDLIPSKPELGRKSGGRSLRSASKKAEDSDDDDDYDDEDDEYDEDDKKGSNDKKSTQTETKTKTKPKPKRTSADDLLTPSKPDLGRSASGGHSLRHAAQKQKKQSKLGRSLSGMHSVRLQEHDGKPNLPKEVLKLEETSYTAGDVLVVRTPEVKAHVRHKKKKVEVDGFYLCVVQAGKKPKNGLKVKWLSSLFPGNSELDSSVNDPWFKFQEKEDIDKISQDTVLCSAKAEKEDKGYKISVYERKRILKLLLEEHLSDVAEGVNEDNEAEDV